MPTLPPHRALRPIAGLLVALGLAACANPGAPNAPTPSASTTASAAAPASREDIAQLFQKLSQDRPALERMVEQRFGMLTGRKRDLMVEHLAQMFTTPGFADAVHELVAPMLARRADTPGAAAGQLAAIRENAAALGMRLTQRGLVRLPPADQERFLRDAIELHRGIDARTCRALVDDTMSPQDMQLVELRHNASRPDAQFEATLALARRAMRAELANQPARPAYTDGQREAGERAWGRAINTRMKAPGVRQRLDRIQADPKAASDADVCWQAVFYLEAMLDIRGPERTWQLHNFVRDLAGDAGKG